MTDIGTNSTIANNSIINSTTESNQLRCQLLDEYVKITKIIDNIQEKIERYKKNVARRIEKSKNKDEQTEYVNEFKEFIQIIKHDTDIINKYRLLKKRQNDIRILLTSHRVEKSCVDQINQEQQNNITSGSSDEDSFVEKTVQALDRKYKSLSPDVLLTI